MTLLCQSSQYLKLEGLTLRLYLNHVFFVIILLCVG